MIFVATFWLQAYCAEDKEYEPGDLFFQVETRATFSGGENTPFWMVSNMHGLGSPVLDNGYVRGSLFKPIYEKGKISWGAGVDLAAGWNLPSVFSIRQLYAEFRYRALLINLGSRDFVPEYNNPRLSSGDLLFSGNAMAIPQLRIGTAGFAPFWGTKGWLAVKAYLAYGIFTDSRWVKNWVTPDSQWVSGVLFCSRGVWFRVGKPDFYPVSLDVGIEMGTQFGGTVHSPEGLFKMPHGIVDWIKAFIPFPGGASTPESEQTNVQGNMTGEYNFSLSWKPTAEWDVRLYYEHFFEDHSQMFLEYGAWKDGLWGCEIRFPKNPFVDKFVFEYVSTKDQTGAVYHDSTPEIPEQISGRDGYYSHYLYGAWQNWGMTMGTPLAISPIYNRTHVLSMYDSRFVANHFGIEGSPTPFLRWRMLMTFSQNWGTYNRPLPYRMDNFSGLAEIEGDLPGLKGWYAKAALGWDKGSLLGNNFGGLVSIGYKGNFSILSSKR